MFGAFYFSQPAFAQGTPEGEEPPVPPVPVPSVGAIGGGARGRRMPNPQAVRLHQQFQAERRMEAQHAERLAVRHAQDEADLMLIFSAWLNIR